MYFTDFPLYVLHISGGWEDVEGVTRRREPQRDDRNRDRNRDGDRGREVGTNASAFAALGHCN